MGARLVSGALQPHWARTLTPLEHRLYVHMCHKALDKGSEGKPPGLYWAGIDAMILALWGDVPQEGTPGYATAKRRTHRIVAELIEAEAIEQRRRGRYGVRAEYLVTPWSFSQDTLIPLPKAE